LINKGADVNHVDATGSTPAMTAVGWFGQYRIGLLLLEAGADHTVCRWRNASRLVHLVVQEGRQRGSTWTQEQKADYEALVRWLERHGESIEQAGLDQERWSSWSTLSGEYARKMDAEVAAQKTQQPPPNPEHFFDDPKVIALCRAINANDLTEIDRFIADGADVNAPGKGTMTPLLWASPPKWALTDPPDRLDTFKWLLAHGANPNIEFATNSRMRLDGYLEGDSVTHLVCETPIPGYFQAVFEHGGDPNFLRHAVLAVDQTPLFTVIKGDAQDKKARIQSLLAKGASIDHQDRGGYTAAMQAVDWGEQFDIVLMLLEAGADPRVAVPSTNKRLIHLVLEKEHKANAPKKRHADYLALLHWLEAHGESVGKARMDILREKATQRDRSQKRSGR
jgi:ankyrin repeat protein